METDLNFDRIVYFGDSLTDGGGFFAASSAVALFGIPPTAAGYAEQFSNGPVYAELTPGLIGVEGGEELNFAIGGAQALTDRSVEDLLTGSGLIRGDAAPEDLAFRVDFKGQVARFLADPSSSGDLSATAVSIFIGLNDFDDFAPTSAETAVDEVIAFGAAIATAALTDAATLAAAGAGTFILHTLPDVSVFPGTQNDTPDLQALGQIAAEANNATLRAGAAQLEAAGAEVVFVDTAAIYGAVERDFESFGFQTLDDQVVLGSNGADGVNPDIAGIPLDQVAFYDAVHPTEALHGVLAGFEAASLTSDVAIGDDGDNRQFGGRGEDLTLGAEGDDRIGLRRGDDVAIAGLGDDVVRGGRGDDLIMAGAGDDRTRGGEGRDIVADGLGDDRSFGGKGRDLLIDGQGADEARGGLGDDVFVFTEDALRGDDANDANTLRGGAGEDTVIIRVSDESVADARSDGPTGSSTVFDDLNLTIFNIENVIVVEGTDLSDEDFYTGLFETADLWNLI